MKSTWPAWCLNSNFLISYDMNEVEHTKNMDRKNIIIANIAKFTCLRRREELDCTCSPFKTRMHSSRMRTTGRMTLPGRGGVLPPDGVPAFWYSEEFLLSEGDCILRGRDLPTPWHYRKAEFLWTDKHV